MKKAIKEESVPFDGINYIDLELNFDSQRLRIEKWFQP